MNIFILTAANMSKDDLISHLYDEINRQNTWYMWTVGILVALITLIIGYFSILQWRISDKQLSKMKKAIKEANDRSEELCKMNDALLKNSVLAIVRNQFLIGFPDWRSDIEFFEYVKERILVSKPSIIKYVKTQIASDFALYIHESCKTDQVFSPADYMVYEQEGNNSSLEYIADVKEKSIYETIDNLKDKELKIKLFSDFKEFMNFWNNN